MAESLDQLLAPQEVTDDLDELIGEAPPSSPLPAVGVKAQAANVALLSESNGEGMGEYQIMVDENQFGINDRVKLRMQELKANYSMILKDSLMQVLADPELGIEQKQNAVNTIRDGHTDNLSTSEILTANALSQPSAGQSEYDNAVNTTTAEMVKEVDRTASEIQSLVNGVKAARDPSKAKQLVELLEVMLTPAEQGISLAGVQTSRFVEGEVSALDVFKA